MSSSRRSSRSRARRQDGRCPTSGARRVAPVVEDVALRVGRRRHIVQRVPHERCQSCGERIFGLEASQRFDAEILRPRRGHAA